MAKELLGIIRSKNASLPLPNGEVNMDGENLKSEGAVAYVVETHLLGKNSLVHLSVPTGSTELHLHARIPGLSWFETGENVYVKIDPEQVFIFSEHNA